jgi:S-adenosylmethionine hydrolase
MEAGGQRLLLPDNGCCTGLLAKLGTAKARHLNNAACWRPSVSSTFHGRDILAPAAAHLSLGLDPAKLGPEVNDWVTLPIPRATLELDGQRAFGVVVHVDAFGNLITNLEADLVEAVGPCRVRIGGHSMAGLVKTYADAAPGSLVTLISSFGTLEVAVVNGSAAERLGIGVGTAIMLERLPLA